MYKNGDIVRLNINYINNCNYSNDFKKWCRKNKDVKFYIDEVLSNDEYIIKRVKYNNSNCKIIIVDYKDIMKS